MKEKDSVGSGPVADRPPTLSGPASEPVQHTPGPWRFDGRLIFAADGLSLNNVSRRPAEDAANARLIAAAPDMLAALRHADNELRLFMDADAVCDHSVNICWCEYNRMREQMRAAIAKATGAQQP